MATKQQLKARVEALAAQSGLPLALQAWNPGDGHNRYELYVRSNETTGYEAQLGRCLNAGEMYEALRLASDMLSLVPKE